MKSLHQKIWIFLATIILLSSILLSCKKGGGGRNKEQQLKIDSLLYAINGPEQPNVLSEKLFNGAWKIILAELKKYNWKKLFAMRPEEKLKHELILVKEFPATKGFNKILLVITFTISSEYNCHGCLGKTSLFEFEQKGNTWKLKKKALAFANGYEWGLIPDVEVLNLCSLRQYGVMVETGFTSLGYSHEEKYLYTFVKGKLREVFMYKSYNSNAEGDIVMGSRMYKYSTKMKLVKGIGEYFDIVLSSNGEFGDMESDNGKRFTFDGSKYVERGK
jgi:hypothetical protein